ncbi:MAG: hypothetical protein CMB80_26260 [Flammeovirgaceae bacterium]|nr:hypothetical protein [Flammeovirgaceae bacterium]MBE63657.1 hypothetical protein [Flammeovirgaceae bacterium]|tara:strand:- start:6905 stop:7279 length:375 start_codon:yes stop_codon:yes gene_type:complete
MGKQFSILGAVLGGLVVAIGAFGAHALNPILEANQRVDTFETAVQYHMFHALALLIVGVITKEKTHRLLKSVGYLFLFGILIFSGSLYILSITNITLLGAITPLGGVAFILGWILLVVYLIKSY